MVLFARSGLTYVLNMFSFIRRRRAADLLFYSGRKTSAAYVQQKFSGMRRTRGARGALVILGLAQTRCEGPSLWLPGHWGWTHTARWQCHQKGAHRKMPAERCLRKGARHSTAARGWGSEAQANSALLPEPPHSAVGKQSAIPCGWYQASMERFGFNARYLAEEPL